MKSVRRIAAYTLLDLKRNLEILEELQIELVKKKIKNTNLIGLITYQGWNTPEFQN